MKIKELYKDNEEITIESYLNKHGITDIQEYLYPTGKYLDNPIAYENMREAVQLIKYHILQHSSMYIIQDADFDGIASAYELFDYLHILSKSLGIQLDIKVLIHDNKECGLGDKKIFNYIKENPRELLIIPDAGTNEVKETRELFDMGIDVLILDHHDINTPVDCGVLVNNQVGNVDRQGSGGVVTHNFLRMMDIEFDVKLSGKYIDIVALSIISDSMDVTSMQNRVYLYYGLFSSNCIQNEFLKALIDKFIPHEQFTIKDLAWSIVPKFNAIVRCGDNEIKKKLFLALLGMFDVEEALKICEDAHANQVKNVKNFVSDNKDKAITNNNLVVISSDDLFPSYSGLIAGKFCEQTHKPCIVGKIKKGKFMGSLRSPIDLAEQINETNLAKAMGHPRAAGFFVLENNIPKLIDFVNTLDINVSDDIEVVKSFYTSDIPNYLFTEFNEYNIWGIKDLPKPIFHIKKVKIKTDDITVMKEKHLKFKYKDVEFLYFNTNKEQREEIFKHKKIELEVIGELSQNVWRNKVTNQVIIEQIELKESKLEVEDLF